MAGMFDASLDNSPVPLQQHPAFAAALCACGQSPLILPGDAPILVTRQRIWPGFPVAMLARAQLEMDQINAQLHSADLHRSLVILSPENAIPLGKLGAVPLVSPATIAEIDLRPDIESRRAALHQKWRNRLIRAETTKSLRVTQRNMPLDPTHWLLRADSDLQKQRGYRGWPTALTLAYARENPNQARLFVASEGRNPVAAMLFLRHGGAVTYHIGHTTDRGRQLSAHNLLLWQACNWLAAKGHQTLDLGQLNTENSAGLARFKLGSGARPRRLGGTWVWWPKMGRLMRPLAALDHHLMRPSQHFTASVARGYLNKRSNQSNGACP